MIPRELQHQILRASKKYPLVGILGPRQSGKTTLAQMAFPKKTYISFENPQIRSFATHDPQGFFKQYAKGAILDEIQRVPSLFSYLQTIVDERKSKGMFILTGSQNFVLMENVTQSLAGRISLHKLLPLSLTELKKGVGKIPQLNDLLFSGGYPRIYDQSLQPTDWLQNYVETYLERDVRSLKNVGNLSSFQKFIRMCAARSGQLLNLSELGNDCGITHNTAKAWLSVLEASFLVFQLAPHYRNFNKRLKKSPKLYFYDTGLLCYLLGITKPQELVIHSQRGAIFETFVLSELIKQRLNHGIPLNFYFWQEQRKREIDCLIERGEKLTPVEIKSGQTIADDYFDHLRYWQKMAGRFASKAYLVYAGDVRQKRVDVEVIPWTALDEISL
ncbi:MAG: AAA family ATPase [Deltaproteobacteria bacterium RIFCSPLOWO2_12_FULL_40_28]|nr:MAG: AAA family ATPase [Deltaproteobacteria bacterium RIFCSPHIGHO2_02_FULL_40_28]OGQ19997.1 MAG: AAA family ATPase [Deltaproteobacteria bacterium RIFCSPHIGHO2_12_FULL_40_32]OGQ39707.1 MAG: AAA family ATPase [Deltaproteobacteria bacterium RIFCSPLOWO2_02_FULL_40_36]OGQ52962.1 MAG: AAA family ATPase [Deltaproteobacteria bacterium RIFCSPLOWO2_12_FULL_40_28]